MVLAGDFSEILSVSYLMDYSFSVTAVFYFLDGHRIEIFLCLVDINGVFILYERVCVFIRQTKYIFPVVPRYYVMPVLRVEIPQFLYSRASEMAYLLEVEHLVYLEGIHDQRHFYGFRSDSMLFVVSHCI